MTVPTGLGYYQDPYQTHLQTQVADISLEGDMPQLYLAETIFFPQGGGQPSDQGNLKGLLGRASVQRVTMQDGLVCHWATVEGDLNPGDDIACDIDWERRHWYMRVHTAGHLVHDALMGLVEGLIPQRGEHGDNPYLKYKGTVAVDDLPQRLEAAVNQFIGQDRTVITIEATLAQLRERATFVPPNLPAGKPLRILQIDGFEAMPDGGVHIKSLGELGHVSITSIRLKKGNTTVKYEVS